MAPGAVRAVQICILVASVGLSVGDSAAPGLPPVEQKFEWKDLKGLRQKVRHGLEKKTHELSQLVSSYSHSAMEFAKAVNDEGFTKAVQDAGICDKVQLWEKKTGLVVEDEMPELMADSKSTSPETVDCKAVATELTAENMKRNLLKDVHGPARKLLELVTSRSAAALCEGKNGIKHWLEKNAELQASDPDKYAELMKQEIDNKVGATLVRFTKQLCGPNPLIGFSAGTPATLGWRTGGVAPAALLAALALALVSLGALAARRATRQAGALGLEPSVPEALLQGGAEE